MATASSADESVVSVSVLGHELIIDAMAPGVTEVTVTTDSNGKLARTMFTVSVTSASTIGDVNMDGRVTINDLTDLVDILLGSVLTMYDMNAADVSRDGRISIADVTGLIDMLLTAGNH